MAFSDWQLWADAPHFSRTAFAETLDGGQAFRWNRIKNCFEGRWAKNTVRLRQDNSGILWCAPTGDNPEAVGSALAQYFALDTDFAGQTDALPWRSDPVLKTAIEAFPGLRILRQPLGETLFGFLCSSTKQIPQIKAICEAVAIDMGDPLPDGSHALPSWAQIAAAGETRLREAKLGYRARYINQTAVFLSQNPGWLDETEALPTSEARQRLISLPGVGRKIADCVLLFGMGRLEAFPIDTWVQKILVRAYGLEGWKSDPLLDFARVHFGPSAGLAQQYLFAAARAGLIAKK
ncbi:DNA-3-methyladenine glycosylase family protein [Coraliomargarita sinensis]|uniref:DNA-3-methyladenine glycosylase family protein n=1 Tax=Coraliomargarita sinensis TaxID=2174842 RepID=UPI001304F3B2|nr:DNA glycosylase [Coraliomargarita sinensis]